MDELDLLQAYDPAKSYEGVSAAELRAAEVRITKSAHKPQQLPHLGRRRILALGVTATVLAAGGLAYSWAHGPSPAAYAATPPVLTAQHVAGTGSSALRMLAARAAEQPSLSADPQTVTSQEWNLNSRIDGQSVTSCVQPVKRELSWAADGTGTLKVTALTPTYGRRASQSPPAGTVLDHTVFTRTHPYRSIFGSTRVPSSPDTVLEYLSVGHPVAQYGTAELFVAVSDLLNERRLSGAQTSAVLNALATRPDVELLGSVTDRAGRSGTALSTTSSFTGLPTSYVLVVDSSSGRILALEKWLTQTAGALKVRIPAVISYTLWT